MRKFAHGATESKHAHAHARSHAYSRRRAARVALASASRPLRPRHRRPPPQVAYSVFYVLGTLGAMVVPFVGYGGLKQAEAAASHGVFVLLQLAAGVDALAAHV